MKCSQVDCKEVACWSYIWPGKAHRMFACDPCYKKAEGIAKTLGFHLGEPMLVDEEGNRSIFDDVDQ